jgi:hypothetical protein
MIRIFSEFLLFSFWWKDIKAIYVEETVWKKYNLRILPTSISLNVFFYRRKNKRRVDQIVCVILQQISRFIFHFISLKLDKNVSYQAPVKFRSKPKVTFLECDYRRLCRAYFVSWGQSRHVSIENEAYTGVKWTLIWLGKDEATPFLLRYPI